MGLPMTRNLARSGFIVRAWNRSPEKAQSLADEPLGLCSTPAQAVDGATVLLMMLSDTDAVLEVMDGDEGALAATSEGIVWLQMSTIGLEGTQCCIELAEGLGLDPSLVLDALAGGPLDLPYRQTKGKAMIERSFAPARTTPCLARARCRRRNAPRRRRAGARPRRPSSPGPGGCGP